MLLLCYILCFVVSPRPVLGQNQRFDNSEHIPRDFISKYYQAYGQTPTSAKLSPFYADSVILEDPTFGFICSGKKKLFEHFDDANKPNYYLWNVQQNYRSGDVLISEGLLDAKYYDVPYQMRFVNIFHFRNGLIAQQFDYYDSKHYFQAIEKWKTSQQLSDRDKDLQMIRHLKEIEWPKAYQEQDTVLLERILADEFQLIGSDGSISDKSGQLKYISTHKPNYDRFDFRITRLEIFENNSAVVSGTGIIEGTDATGKYRLTYHSSNHLIKRGSLWKAISSHTSGDKLERQ